MSGTVLVTGASDGLGRALARELAADGASVLVHGRDHGRADEAVAAVRERAPGTDVRPCVADFASLAEVGALADELLRDGVALDALVNNAGIGSTLPGDGRRMESVDGYELRFAVNYLAGYLLTRRLLPLMQRSAPARIVNVSSAGQMPIDFGDVMLERAYDGVRAYCQSKLAQVMFTFDLAGELDGSRISATALHPATYMPTKMVLAARGSAMSTLEEGVEATRRLVDDPALEGVTGRYFEGKREARADAQAYDSGARARLRALSDELTGLA